MTDLAEALPPPELRGRLEIHDGVVETIARRSAAAVSSTHHVTGLDRLVSSDLPRARVVVGAGQVAVTVTVAAQWPTPVASLAGRVRDAVSSAVSEQTGLTVTRVDVEVHCTPSEEPPTARRVR